MTQTLKARVLRKLVLKDSGSPGRPAYLGAASGLVHAGKWLYVVADDENHLAIFDDEGERPGELIRIFDGDLPVDKKARKKVKPDLEALLRVSHPRHAPSGGLLLIPSGSKKHRDRGALLRLDAHGKPQGEVVRLDFSQLLDSLPFDPPNIEAAAVCAGNLCLLNRGNKKNQPNAIVLFDLEQTWAALIDGKRPRAPRVKEVALGDYEGVPLSFTDASAVGDRLVFSAVAERTDDSYEDGPTAAAGIGILDLDARVHGFATVTSGHKIEGISARRENGRYRCLLVNDEDDPTICSSLLECSFDDIQGV